MISHKAHDIAMINNVMVCYVIFVSLNVDMICTLEILNISINWQIFSELLLIEKFSVKTTKSNELEFEEAYNIFGFINCSCCYMYYDLFFKYKMAITFCKYLCVLMFRSLHYGCVPWKCTFLSINEHALLYFSLITDLVTYF